MCHDAGVVPWPLRILFWTWLLVSIGIYGYRIVRRVGRRDVEVDQPEAGLAPTTLPSGPSFSDRMAGAPPSLPPQPLPEGALVQEAIREELRAQGRLAEGDDRSPASGDPAPTGRQGFFAAAGGEQPAIADALAGMVVPDDLVPLMTTGVGEVGLHRALFIGSRLDPAAVGRALGDELERMGYALHSTSDTAVEGRRDDGAVTVQLHIDAASVVVDGVKAFPTARLGDLVVEFTN